MDEYTRTCALLNVFMNHLFEAVQTKNPSYVTWYLDTIMCFIPDIPNTYQWMYKQQIKSVLDKHPEIKHQCTRYDI